MIVNLDNETEQTDYHELPFVIDKTNTNEDELDKDDETRHSNNQHPVVTIPISDQPLNFGQNQIFFEMKTMCTEAPPPAMWLMMTTVLVLAGFASGKDYGVYLCKCLILMFFTWVKLKNSYADTWRFYLYCVSNTNRFLQERGIMTNSCKVAKK
ncbi:unnamed protein product [Acanthoscelides obtectus]|uniref:Uncharacterized protein n=1 Tax=Acanthoscelides obtectus TaxID=200917 RepID=A0A9P0MGH1_ACAOB|nr:unnamed protein product [Acanthoscelides obtectus]CAK1659563.1 hypothetical protein AOBTE_LOCUS21539 [Acanthoscelides obtectus]